MERNVWEIEGRTCSKWPRAGFKPGALRSGLSLSGPHPVSHRGAPPLKDFWGTRTGNIFLIKLFRQSWPSHPVIATILTLLTFHTGGGSGLPHGLSCLEPVPLEEMFIQSPVLESDCLLKLKRNVLLWASWKPPASSSSSSDSPTLITHTHKKPPMHHQNIYQPPPPRHVLCSCC